MVLVVAKLPITWVSAWPAPLLTTPWGLGQAWTPRHRLLADRHASSRALERLTWQRTWPGTNYGILTGEPSGVDVFDFDVAGCGFTLMLAWRQLEDRIGPIPESWTVVTGGGVHVYVRHVPGAGSHPRIFGLPIDYLSSGRQAVGPGSVHHSGTIYRELNPGAGVVPLPQPARLVAALHGRECVANPHGRSTVATPEPAKRQMRCARGVTGEQALQRALAAISAAGEGSRDDTLNREVYFLGPYMATRALQPSDVEEVCRQAALKAGLALREVQATLRSACGDGMRDSAPPAAPEPLPGRSCGSAPVLTGRSFTRVRRRYQPLTAWSPGELTPALACIWRTFTKTTWLWRGAALDRLIFEHLLGLAQARGVSLEVEASLRYLSAELGAHTKYVGEALKRLCSQGWLSLARQGGPLGRGSVRAPSAYRLQVPRRLAVPAPDYPSSPRAHQQKKPSMVGSSPGFAGDLILAVGECEGGGGGPGAGQERLGGDGSEIWAVPTGVLVAEGTQDQGSRRRRVRRRLVVQPKNSAAPRWARDGDPELRRVLAVLQSAGLEATVCRS
ncbi:MAG: hypothetical protein NVSMB32_06520 [Actinomycetota bacterium]